MRTLVVRIATFNVQNLRLRTRDGQPVLDGASDRDGPRSGMPVRQAIADRRETARLIASAAPDVIALQEVFDIASLDHFHNAFLLPTGLPPFPHRYCFRGNDGSGNVAAMLRHPPLAVRSHAALTGADLGLSDLPVTLRDEPIFRRDCLEVALEDVTLFICHFKAPYPDTERALMIRKAEARAVRGIIEARFDMPEKAHWIVLGDLNEPGPAARGRNDSLGVLKNGFAVDLMDRLPAEKEWTYEVPGIGLRTCPDRIMLSPALAEKNATACPRILHAGRGETEGAPRPSDHALVYVDLDIG